MVTIYEITTSIYPLAVLASFCVVSMVHLEKHKPKTSDSFFYAFGGFLVAVAADVVRFFIPSNYLSLVNTIEAFGFLIGLLFLVIAAWNFVTEERRIPNPFF